MSQTDKDKVLEVRAKFCKVTEALNNVAHVVEKELHDGREKSLVKTKIDEAMIWSIYSIADSYGVSVMDELIDILFKSRVSDADD